MKRFLSLLMLLMGLWLPMACDKDDGKDDGGSTPSSFIIHIRVPPAEKNLEFSLNQGTLNALADDAFGRQFEALGLNADAQLIIKRDGAEIDRLSFKKEGSGVWFFAGSPTAFTSAPPVLPQNDQDLVVYFVPGPSQAKQNW